MVMNRSSTDDEHEYENISDNNLPSVRTNNISNNRQGSYLEPVEESDNVIEEILLQRIPPTPGCTKKRLILIIVVVTLLVVLSACLISAFVFNVVLKSLNKTTNDTLTFDDGIYVGEIYNGQANGYGVLTKSNGHRYVGKFNSNMLDGQGMLFISNNSKFYEKVYEGNFLQNEFDGPGVYYYRDGSRYEGMWRNNQRHGNGEIVFDEGRVRRGQWIDDKFIERVNTKKT